MRLTLLFVLFLFISMVFGKDLAVKNNKQLMRSLTTKKIYPVNATPQEPVNSILESEYDQQSSHSVPTVAKQTSGENFTNVMIDSSRNGFGWLNAGIRSIDRFKGVDASSVNADFLVLAYRQYILSNAASGIIGASTVDVSGGLAQAKYFRHVELNQDLYGGTIGGRYPGVVALDRPFIAFNQYISGDANTSPAVSSPYLITDYSSYGDNGGLWTSSYKMDQGYTHDSFPSNRLWNGSVSIVKDDAGTYHYIGAYRNWTLSTESQPHEYVVLNAASADPTGSWTIDSTPTQIDTMDFVLYPVVSMNKSGFGAFVGIGHQGPHAGDTFFMSELRLMVKTTSDYGKTWSATREISWAELGLPENIIASDSIYVPDTDTTTVIYSGPAYVAIPNNHAVDVLVSETNDIYIGFDITWGPEGADNTYYRNARHCGVHAAISNDGGSNFYDSHIAINNGFYEGDSSDDAAADNFVFDSEVDLSLDENGNLYATWLDRPQVNIEVAEHLRYDNTNSEILLKTDVFTARSLDGGAEWSWKMNVTQTKSIDEYELKAVRNADGSGDGAIYYAYCTIDPNTSTGTNPDAYVYRTNRVWVGHAFNYPKVDAIREGDNGLVNSFKLQQNFPNPFNPKTSIEYELATSGRVALNVYNMLGQRVQTLVNQRQNAGVYRINFDGAELASGIYFYQLKVGAQVEVRKMILLK